MSPRAPQRPFRLLTCALLLLAACATPTLPLPPPSALLSPPDNDGWVTVTGEVLAGAIVFVFNENSGAGVIGVADDMGAFEVRVQAMAFDDLTIWQELGTKRGPDLHASVPPRL